MGVSAIIPVESMDAANAHLDALGFGPDNFSVPFKAPDGAGFAALHCWDRGKFKTAISAMIASGKYPGLAMRDTVRETLSTLAATRALARVEIDDIESLQTVFTRLKERTI